MQEETSPKHKCFIAQRQKRHLFTFLELSANYTGKCSWNRQANIIIMTAHCYGWHLASGRNDWARSTWCGRHVTVTTQNDSCKCCKDLVFLTEVQYYTIKSKQHLEKNNWNHKNVIVNVYRAFFKFFIYYLVWKSMNHNTYYKLQQYLWIILNFATVTIKLLVHIFQHWGGGNNVSCTMLPINKNLVQIS